MDPFFNAGGAQVSPHDREKVVNIQNIASVINGRHTIRFGGNIRPRFLDAFDTSNFGGTFTFGSLAAYTAGQPFKFTVNQGNPRVSFTQNEFSTFIEDQFRMRPDFSVSVGLRHEFQTHVSRPVFGNLAPTAAYDAVDAAVAQAMQAAWIAFARIGVPCHTDGSPWPSYDSTAPLLTWIEDELTTRPLVADALTTLIHALRSEGHQNTNP